jgi:5'-deoxynucleotidase YfbR-like HD superfamily hydrolase
MKTVPFTMDEQFRMSEVKRWHVINTAREQTLADHSFQVALTLSHMVSWAISDGDLWTRDEAYWLLLAGLLHDAHEVWLGDRPTCAKQFSDRPSETPTVAVYEDTLRGLGRKRSQGEQFLKIADTVEALVWLNQNGVGSHAATVVTEIRDRARALLESPGVPATVQKELIHYIVSQGVKWI